MIPFAVIVVLLIFLLNLSVHVELRLQKGKYSLLIRYGKIRLLRLPIGKKKHKKPETEQTNTVKEKKTPKMELIRFVLSELEDIFSDLKKLFHYTRKHILCHDLLVDLTFGKEDAALVGVLYGIIWAGIGNLLPLIQSIMVLKSHRINVNPVYNQEYFDFSCAGRFHMKIWHILAIGMKAAFAFIKYKKRFTKKQKS